MRFISMIKAGKDYEAGLPPDEKLAMAMGQLIEEATASGVLLSAEGLQPSSKGARLTQSRGRLTVTDGPFTEAKEVIGGFAIFQAKSKKEAVEFAARFMKLHVEILGPEWEGECELRQLEDYPPPGN